MTFARILRVWLIISLLSGFCGAQGLCVFDRPSPAYSFDSCIQYFQGDISERQDLAHIPWQDPDQFHLHSYSQHDFWQKIRIKNEGKEPLLLVWKEYIAKDTLVRFYQSQNQQIVKICSSGTSVPSQYKCINTRYAAAMYRIDPHEVKELIIEKSSSNQLYTRQVLISPQLFQDKYQEGVFVGYHYIGFAVGIFVVNLLMFLVLRQRIFASYLIFHICIVWTALLITGLVQSYLPFYNWGKWMSFSAMLTGLALINFCVQYFSISWRRLPLFFKILFAWPIVQSSMYWLGIGWHPFDDETFFVLVLILVLYALYRYRINPNRMRFFLIAWSGYMIFLSSYLLCVAKHIPDWWVFRYGAFEAHAWEMTWFTVGFANLIFIRIRVAIQDAEHLRRDKEEILRRFSHELRTPLMGILGEVQSQASPDESWDHVKISSHKLLGIVNNVIDYMDFNEANYQTICEHIKLDDQIVQIIQGVALRHGDRRIAVQIDCYQIQDLYFEIDVMLLQKSLAPLVDNAFKYAQESPVIVRVDYQDKVLRINLINLGMKFSQNDLEHYSTDFRKGEIFLRQRYGGLGLGLSVANACVMAMAGRLGVVEYVDGAHLYMEIPIAEIKTSLAPALDSVTEQPSKFAPKVLVVDDQLLNRKVLSKMLANFTVDVDLAEDGLIAYKKWRRENYALILMDLQMPRLDGLEATRWIRKIAREKSLPSPIIVAVSAHVSSSSQQECVAAGLDAFLAKPMSKEQMETWLQKARLI